MTRNELYAIMQGSNESTFDRKLKFLEQKLLSSYSENDIRIHDIKQKITNIKHNFKQKWLAARKTKARFEENNVEWLSASISLPATGMYLNNNIFFSLIRVSDFKEIDDTQVIRLRLMMLYCYPNYLCCIVELKLMNESGHKYFLLLQESALVALKNLL